MSKISSYLIALLLPLLLVSCAGSTPKPRGYFRIDLDKKQYDTARIAEPILFEYPSNVATITTSQYDSDAFDITYPKLNAKIYCTYKVVNDTNLYSLTEDSRKFTYAHVSKAENIEPKIWEYPEKDVYGVLFLVDGNVASQTQFFLTDSTHHFLRGSLYFNNRPNKDSLAPVAAYITEDIVRIMESAEWK